VLSELSRVELLDRSLALGAQALLALIPLLIVLNTFLPAALVEDMVAQVRDIVGLRDDVMAPIRDMAMSTEVRRTETGVAGLLVSLASASSFSRALQRMYAKTWELPGDRGVRALRSSLTWILGWLVVVQATAMLIRSLATVPNTGLLRTVVQLAASTALWWWTSRLLLGGRVGWGPLLPGAVLTGLLLLGLTRLSAVFMPPFTRSNLEQFGPLGVVFAVGSWLVVFGGVLVAAAVVGRQVSLWWLPEGEPDTSAPAEPGASASGAPDTSSPGVVSDTSASGASSAAGAAGDLGGLHHRTGLPRGEATRQEERPQGEHRQDEQRGPQPGQPGD
jgi:membrane protein